MFFLSFSSSSSQRDINYSLSLPYLCHVLFIKRKRKSFLFGNPEIQQKFAYFSRFRLLEAPGRNDFFLYICTLGDIQYRNTQYKFWNFTRFFIPSKMFHSKITGDTEYFILITLGFLESLKQSGIAASNETILMHCVVHQLPASTKHFFSYFALR